MRAPTYAHDINAVETIYGTIMSFDGRYALQLRDDRGFFDNVEMVQGTIINPTGQRLKTGMRVSVRGSNRGLVLVAMQIDTHDVPLAASTRSEPAALSHHQVRPFGPDRETQRLQAERLQQYRADQEAYHRAQAAYARAEEVKARAAAQRLASKLARLQGGQGWPTAVHSQRHHKSRIAHLPSPAAHQTAHQVPFGRSKSAPADDIVKTRMPPAKIIAPIGRVDPAVANGQSIPSWFGWGKL